MIKLSGTITKDGSSDLAGQVAAVVKRALESLFQDGKEEREVTVRVSCNADGTFTVTAS